MGMGTPQPGMNGNGNSNGMPPQMNGNGQPPMGGMNPTMQQTQMQQLMGGPCVKLLIHFTF